MGLIKTIDDLKNSGLQKNVIYNGNVLEILRAFPSECVDMVIFSPPYYGLRNYNVEGQWGLEKTFDEYLDKMIDLMREIKRVLKPTGTIWVNFGDCYGGGNNGANDYRPEGASISKNDKKYQGQKGGHLNRFGGNVEKSTLTNPEYNQERGRVGNQKCLLMQPERFAIRCIDEVGLILRNKIVWGKQILLKKENRTIGSVMPSSVKDRFNESYEFLYFFVKNKKYYSNLDAVRLPPETQPWGIQTRIKEGTTAGKFLKTDYFNYRIRDAIRKAGQPQFKMTQKEIEEYKKKTGKIKGGGANLNLPWNPLTGRQIYPRVTQRKQDNVPSRNANLYAGFNERWRKRKKDQKIVDNKIEEGFSMREFYRQNPELEKYEYNPLGKNLPTVWQINPEPHNFQKELGIEIEHFAIFPQALLEIPIQFGCPPDGIVLDPFMGSGTTAIVAQKLGRDFVGIEISPQYCKLAESRINLMKNLFNKEEK